MRTPHINTIVEWLASCEGGRSNPVFSGYRGQFHLHGKDAIADVEWYPQDEPVPTGVSTICQVHFGRPEVHLPKIQVGDAFEVREGKRIVGRGKVTSLIEAR